MKRFTRLMTTACNRVGIQIRSNPRGKKCAKSGHNDPQHDQNINASVIARGPDPSQLSRSDGKKNK